MLAIYITIWITIGALAFCLYYMYEEGFPNPYYIGILSCLAGVFTLLNYIYIIYYDNKQYSCTRRE